MRACGKAWQCSSQGRHKVRRYSTGDQHAAVGPAAAHMLWMLSAVRIAFFLTLL
jgi:hypothetical protein